MTVETIVLEEAPLDVRWNAFVEVLKDHLTERGDAYAIEYWVHAVMSATRAGKARNFRTMLRNAQHATAVGAAIPDLAKRYRASIADLPSEEQVRLKGIWAKMEKAVEASLEFCRQAAANGIELEDADE